MFTILLLTAIGQLESWHVKCPQGHAITVQGTREGDQFHATLPSLTLTCPAGHRLNLSGYSYRDGASYHVFFPVAPAPQGTPAGPVKNYGVSTQYFPRHQGTSWYGGNVQYKPAVGKTGESPNRVHVTIIGSQVEREAARKDLEANPEFRRMAEAMGDSLALQDYGPENPLVREIGLVDGGKPDIVIQQTKGGKVVYRAHSYPGSDVLVGEIRKADPSYEPAKDPGGGLNLNADLSVLLAEAGITPEIIVGVAVALALVVAVHKGVL